MPFTLDDTPKKTGLAGVGVAQSDAPTCLTVFDLGGVKGRRSRPLQGLMCNIERSEM